MRMLKHLIRSARPRQWPKNVVVFAGLIFAQKIFSAAGGTLVIHWIPILRACGAFAAFCLVSSATYLLNDVYDRNADRMHPVKRNRPIASGALPVSTAVIASILLFLVGLGGAFLLSWKLMAVLLGYLVLTVAYSVKLKHIVILDVLVLAVGFVLRAFAGTVVIDVNISVWLFICTILLALFLVLAKRRAEMTVFENSATAQRSVLANYSPGLLDQMISVVTAATVVSYAIYTASPSEFHTQSLVLTVPFVIYGLFRYLYLVYQKQVGTDPDKAIFRDVPLLINNLLWLIASGVIIYFF
jgi:4-hydroxybenzoate polyprenyltransferase